MPAGLAGYFSRPEWPPALQHLTIGLPEAVNLGLLLRWHAALTEMRAFQAVPERQRLQIMSELGRAIASALEASPHLRPVAVELSGSGWPQTIFPFEVLPEAWDGRLDWASLKQVHRWLNADVSRWLPAGTPRSARRRAALPCHLGQPVALGRTAALRICVGAQLVRQTASDPSLGTSLEARLETQIQRARLAVRKAELIAQNYDALCAVASPLCAPGAPSPRGRSISRLGVGIPLEARLRARTAASSAWFGCATARQLNTGASSTTPQRAVAARDSGLSLKLG